MKTKIKEEKISATPMCREQTTIRKDSWSQIRQSEGQRGLLLTVICVILGP